MKYYWILLLLLGAVFSLQAQEEAPAERTIFDRSKIKRVGGFGGPYFGWTQVGDHSGFVSGGGGGVVLNNFFLGLFGQGEIYGLVAPASERNRDLNVGYGGLWLGYVTPSHRAVHLFSSLRLGVGGASLGEPDDDDFDFDERSRFMFVTMPEVGVELNLLHWFRISASAGYRFTAGNDSEFGPFNNADFNRPFANLTFRFGGFGHRR